MKIVLVGTFPPFRGGIAHFNELLYLELKKENQVTAINFKRQYPKLFFPGKTQFTDSSVPKENFNIRIIDSINPLSWIHTFRKIKRISPDIVIFKYWMPYFSPTFGTISLLVKKFTDTKTVCILDNIIPHEEHIGYKLLNKYLTKYVDYFICMSDTVVKQLIIL